MRSRKPKIAHMATNPYTTDTSEDALQVQLACLRRMSPQERIRTTCAMSRRVRDMAMNAIRRRHPDWDDSQVRLMFFELTYGKALADDIRKACSGRER